MDKNNKEKRVNVPLSLCIKIAAVAFGLFLCMYYWSGISNFIISAVSAATPVIAGFAIAYVLNILMSFYESHYFTKLSHKRFVQKSRRPVCLVGALLTLIAIVGVVVLLVVPELVECVTFLITKIPPLIEDILNSKWVTENLPKDILSTLAGIDWMSYISSIISTVGQGIGGAVNVLVSALTSFVSAVITTFISIIVSIYLLCDRDALLGQGKRLLENYVSKKHTVQVKYVLSVINESFRRFIVGQCIEALIIGALCGIGMAIFRFPYAPMVGTLVGFTALIPVAGAYIGAGVGAVMMLTVSPLKALLFLVFIIVLQQLEGNIIYPRVVGNSIGLPAVWVLAAVAVGGGLFGIMGMLVGVPASAAVYRLVKEDLQRREAKKQSEEESETEDKE